MTLYQFDSEPSYLLKGNSLIINSFTNTKYEKLNTNWYKIALPYSFEEKSFSRAPKDFDAVAAAMKIEDCQPYLALSFLKTSGHVHRSISHFFLHTAWEKLRFAMLRFFIHAVGVLIDGATFFDSASRQNADKYDKNQEKRRPLFDVSDDC